MLMHEVIGGPASWMGQTQCDDLEMGMLSSTLENGEILDEHPVEVPSPWQTRCPDHRGIRLYATPSKSPFTAEGPESFHGARLWTGRRSGGWGC